MTQEPNSAPGKILVVEDDESTALFVTRVLRRGGLDASWVSDAEQAGELLADRSFDVLLADYRLPGADGAELVRAARLVLPEIATAVMTSFNDGAIEREARSSGADEFFEKPLHPASLVARMTELVSKARASRSRTPGSPPAPAGAEVAVPAVQALEVPPSVGISSAPRSAENGPSGQPPRRGSGVVGGSTDRAGSVGASWREGTGGARWVRLSAYPEADSLGTIGCEGAATEEDPPEGPGDAPGLFGRAPKTRVATPMLVWGTAAPQVSIGSGVAPVTHPNTTPASGFFAR